jgi:hypothetical protein
LKCGSIPRSATTRAPDAPGARRAASARKRAGAARAAGVDRSEQAERELAAAQAWHELLRAPATGGGLDGQLASAGELVRRFGLRATLLGVLVVAMLSAVFSFLATVLLLVLARRLLRGGARQRD